MTPADVHYGRAEQLTTARRQILLEAHRTHPERFVRGTPQPPVLPPQAWINPPTEKTTLLNAAQATSRGGVHTWGTPFFYSTKRDLDRCRCGPHRRHEPPDANRGSLNAARECLKVVDTYRRCCRMIFLLLKTSFSGLVVQRKRERAKSTRRALLLPLCSRRTVTS